MRDKLLNLATSRLEPDARLSFAQCGEDLILEMVFRMLGIDKPYYLDLGAHHPTHLSNTYFFYRLGARGVCIEADPELCAAIAAKRPHDKCVNMGVSIGESKTAPFYVLSTRTLNTFSQAEAERYISYGTHKLEKTLQIPILNVNQIIADHCERIPDLVSLDIEGLDLPVIQSFDFNRHRPAVFCIETITYTEDRTETKIGGIADVMSTAGYVAIADTYINTVFVDARKWFAKSSK